MDFFKKYNNFIIRAYDSKKGNKTIFLLHGYQVNIDIWTSFANKLISKGYRVISIDLPGHGFSDTQKDINTMEFMADIAVLFMDDIKVESAVFMGHSMGGYVSLALAKKYPNKVDAICFLHSTPNSDNAEKLLARDHEIKLIKANKLEASIIEGMGRMFAQKNRARMEELIGDLSASAIMSDQNGLIATLEGLKQRTDMNAFLKDYNKPCLFIFGDQDDRIPEEVRKKIMDDHPKFEYHLLEYCGHACFLEEEEKTIEILDKFIESVN